MSTLVPTDKTLAAISFDPNAAQFQGAHQQQPVAPTPAPQWSPPPQPFQSAPQHAQQSAAPQYNAPHPQQNLPQSPQQYAQPYTPQGSPPQQQWPQSVPQQAPQSGYGYPGGAPQAAVTGGPVSYAGPPPQNAPAPVVPPPPTPSRWLDLADAIDSRIHGHRGVLLLAGAALAVFGGPVGDWLDVSGVGAVGACLFAIVIALIAFASFAGCRDEVTDRFSYELAMSRVSASMQGVGETIKYFSKAPRSTRWMGVGRFVAATALVTLAFTNLAARVTDDPTVWTVRCIAAFFLVVGAFGVFRGWLEGWLLAGGNSYTTANTQELVAAVRALPAIIDCTKPAAWQTQNPLISGVLTTLGSWNSRTKSVTNEASYRVALFRRLQRSLPFASVAEEQWIRVAGKRARRLDLVAKSAGNQLLIEIKSRYGSGEADRAATQLKEYLDLGEGPVLVVLCDVDGGKHVDWLCAQIAALHQAGYPIIAVRAAATNAAGTSLASTSNATTPARQPVRPLLNAIVAGGVFFGVLVTGAMWNQPPAHPRRTQQPRESQARREFTPPIASANSFGTGESEGCVATPDTTTPGYGSGFLVRPRDDIRTSGPSLPAFTRIEVIGRGSPHGREGRRSFQIRSPDGITGYVFLSEQWMGLNGACARYAGF